MGGDVKVRAALFLAVLLSGLALAAPAWGATQHPRPGTLDTTFGKGGRIFSKLRDSIANSQFTALARQLDGKLVVAGNRANGTAWGTEGIIERRGPAGHLDTSFGRAGRVVVAETKGLALQEDGRVLFGDNGPTAECHGRRGRSAIRRLNPDGGTDLSFGTKGCSAPVPFEISRIAVDGDGRIVVAGHAFHCPCSKGLAPSHELVLTRLRPDGSIDSGFGNGGIVRAATELGLSISDASGLALTEGGGIAVAGGRLMIRFAANGALETSFGNGGKVEVAGPARSVLALPGGEIVLAFRSTGYLGHPESSDFALGRYLPDGRLDPGFGTAGVAFLDVGQVDEPAVLEPVPGGGIMLAGAASLRDSCLDLCEYEGVLARFSSDGTLDAGFGATGVAYLGRWPEAPSAYDQPIADLTVAPDGRAFVAGGLGWEGDAYLLGREPGGERDIAFGRHGLVLERHRLPSNTEATGLAIEPSGEIVVSADSDARVRDFRPVLLDFKRSGRPDREVGSGSGSRPTQASGIIRAGPRRALFSVTGGGSVLRFDNRGRLDRRYGTDGEAPLPVGFRVNDFLARRDGSVLVIGRIKRPGMAIYRFTPRGRPDRHFGRRGLAVVSFGGLGTEARSALIERDGRIVLVGRAGGKAAAARLLPGGDPDPSFGHRGRAPGLIEPHTAANIVVRQGGGTLIACERESSSAERATILVRLDRRGHRVSSFGARGVVRPGGDAHPLALFATKRGSILITPRGWNSSGGVVLRAFRSNGALDRRFGRRGMTVAATGQDRIFNPVAAARQSNGRIVVVGTAGAWFTGNKVELLRFN
jgi:uncharacterized delta-60 repeat protein